MSSISDRSAAGSYSSYTRKLSLSMATKHTIEIHIDNHYRSKVYTSSSELTGHISINSQRDAPFDSVQIHLLGTTKTRIDGVNVPHATSHTFLKLTMPISESHYPVPRTLEAGRTYIIPFHFVIPSYLTISACSHHVANEAVRDYHLRLPPTVGAWGVDDLAPEMSRVEYAIKAQVLREDQAEEDDGGATTTTTTTTTCHHRVTVTKLFEASQEIRVLPAHPAEPPLSITPGDKLYAPSKTKTMRRTIFSSRLGAATVTAAQPPAVMLSPDGRSAAGTTARLDLCFEPAAAADRAPPTLPRVASVSAKITAVTYFSASGVRCLPNLGDWCRNFGYDGSGSYSCTTSLPSSSVTAPPVVWTQQQEQQEKEERPEACARRDSGYCSDGDDDDDDDDNPADEEDSDRSGGASTKTSTSTRSTRSDRRKAPTTTPARPSPSYYTASLRVPIQLPVGKKTFLPTFHACITSRVYVLWLSVSLSCGGTRSTATLGVPLQVGVASSSSVAVDQTGLPNFEAALWDAEADAYLRPRVMSSVPASAPDVEVHHHYQHHRRPQSGGEAAAAAAVLPGYAAATADRAVVMPASAVAPAPRGWRPVAGY